MDRMKPAVEAFRNEVRSLLRDVHPDSFRYDLLPEGEDVKMIREENIEMAKVLNALLEVSKSRVPQFLPEPFRSGPHIDFWYGTFMPYTPVREFLKELRGHIAYRRKIDARRKENQSRNPDKG